jgi:3D (Asp-Asp-Asp) domain-containing protein
LPLEDLQIEQEQVVAETNVETAYALTSFQLTGYTLGGEMRLTATAYDACVRCCGKTDGITRSGTQARVGQTIAVDPSVIPLGTKIYIPDLGQVFTAEDTGGAIQGNRIDIYMDNHEKAQDFGVQDLRAYILEEPNEK